MLEHGKNFKVKLEVDFPHRCAKNKTFSVFLKNFSFFGSEACQIFPSVDAKSILPHERPMVIPSTLIERPIDQTNKMAFYFIFDLIYYVSRPNYMYFSI